MDKIIDEFILFKDKIKPGLLCNKYEISKYKININDYYNAEFRGHTLISHYPIEPITDMSHSYIGKVLGYYPAACDLFIPNQSAIINEFIYFGGIEFNTESLFQESLKWCIDKYAKQILDKYGKIEYYKSFNYKSKKHNGYKSVKCKSQYITKLNN